MAAKVLQRSFSNKTFSSIRTTLWIALAVVLAAAGQACNFRSVEGVLRIGIPDEPRTLNIWLASDANSRDILRQFYIPLYERAPDTLETVPWLAADLPVWDAQKLTYTIKLRPAHWSDGQPLTSGDVAFTARLIQEFKLPGLSSRWTNVTSIDTPDEATVVFQLKKPFATFLSRTLEVPIVPAHIWEPIASAARQSEKPLAALLNHEIQNPVGCGPFVLKQWRRGGYLYLEKNPLFFGTGLTIGGQVLGPYIKGMLFKIYTTTDVAMLALRKGDIDIFMQHIQPGYIDVLQHDPAIRIYASPKSGLYYLGMNTRRPPFDDEHLRWATALLVDKDFIVSRLLQGRGTKMHSIIPPGNQPWYNPNMPLYGDGLSREERIRAAYQILSAAGYTWQTPPIDPQGKVVAASGIRLPGGEPMSPFTILTPPADYDPARAISGTFIQEWMRTVGLPASARPMEFGALLQQVRNRQEFDAFILGYGRLSLDPEYLSTFFSSANDKPRGYNMSGYHNNAFDDLANRSRNEMDFPKRLEMIHEMQSIVMADVPYLPLYIPDMLEAVRTDRFAGWVPMLDGIGNRWSFAMLKPIER